ncbi:MAG: hypothetical protein IJ105_03790 [Bacilli bacterium]|nr:hypothetical protein [Bacilli bacterium]
MLTIETKELEISDKLKRKVEMVCRFTNTKPIYQKGSIKSIKETNIAYVRPHVITIKNNKYLMFEETDYVFVNGYEKKIMFKDLENYIKLN